MCVEIILTTISTIAAAVAAWCSYLAVTQSKKNVFLLKRNELALAVIALETAFIESYENFKLSEHQEKQGIILSSKYFVQGSLYSAFIEVLGKLAKLERESRRENNVESLANEIALLFEKIVLDKRLDE